jgi:hypothetical protein
MIKPPEYSGGFLCTRARMEFCCLTAARAQRSEYEALPPTRLLNSRVNPVYCGVLVLSHRDDDAFTTVDDL